MTRRTAPMLAALAAMTTLAACQDASVAPVVEVEAPSFAQIAPAPETAAAISAMMDEMNVALEGAGADFRVAMAEYVTGGDEAGATLLQKDVGNKQLAFDFVPNDPRRRWSNGTDITYAIDQTGDAISLGGGLTAAQTTAAIQRAMDTWDAQQCSDLGLTQNPDFGLDIGYIAWANGLGGTPFVFADVQHAGFRDINFAGGVLGATFTLIWVGADGPTDIDNNGKADVAFREIYYDPSWIWADDGASNVDVESIALHEMGHGLSQAHFGNLFVKRGAFAPSPLAGMNAFYGGPQRDLKGTDVGGHCSNWGQWPQN